MGGPHPSGALTTTEVAATSSRCEPSCAVCQQLTSGAKTVAAVLGVAAVTEERLAARLTAAPEIFSAHMGSAEACLIAAHHATMASLRDEWQRCLTAAETWCDGLVACLRSTLRFLDLDFAAAQLCFAQIAHCSRGLRVRSEAARRDFAELLAAAHTAHAVSTPLPALQFELLIGSWWQAIADEIHHGRHEDLVGAEARLLELAAVFEPVLA
jgi:hypothetical protein